MLKKPSFSHTRPTIWLDGHLFLINNNVITHRLGEKAGFKNCWRNHDPFCALFEK